RRFQMLLRENPTRAFDGAGGGNRIAIETSNHNARRTSGNPEFAEDFREGNARPFPDAQHPEVRGARISGALHKMRTLRPRLRSQVVHLELLGNVPRYANGDVSNRRIVQQL